jgi:molybdopterin-biosynthesis enzyme MoeA-like protein
MATFPLGAKAIPNPVGTAPAVTLRQKGVRFIVLPGVPAGLQSIFGQSFESLIRRLSRTQYFYETSLIVWSLLESQLAPMIDRVMKHIPGVYMKSHAEGGEGTEEGNIGLHFSAKAAKLKLSKMRILKALTLMSELLGRSMPDNWHPRAAVSKTTVDLPVRRL